MIESILNIKIKASNSGYLTVQLDPFLFKGAAHFYFALPLVSIRKEFTEVRALVYEFWYYFINVFGDLYIFFFGM